MTTVSALDSLAALPEGKGTHMYFTGSTALVNIVLISSTLFRLQ